MAFFSLGWSIFKETTLAHNLRHDDHMLENITTLSETEFFKLGEVSLELKNLAESYILEGKSRPEILSQLEQDYLFLSKIESFYDQIRLFDQAGMEIIRVENRGNQQTLIGKELLEDKSAQPYFQKIAVLETDEYYLTRPKVMTENGVTILPIKIIVQSFFPVDNKLTGERFGYININLDADPLFGEIKANFDVGSGQAHILDSNGGWIFSRREGEEFEILLGQEVSFKNNSPEIWKAIDGKDKGVLNFREETIVFSKVNVVPNWTISSSGALKTRIKPENQRFINSFYLVSIITLPTYTKLLGISPSQTFLIWGGYLVFTFLLSFWIAYLVATRLALQDRARYSMKMEAIGELTAGLAHDFNNLLTAVIGNLGLMEREDPSPTAKQLIANASDAAWRGAELTKRLLAFSRKQNLEPQTLDLVQLLKETKTLVVTTIGDGLAFKLILPKEKLMVRLDPLEFQNVVLNLAINARDAMKDGGNLEISVMREHFTAETAGKMEISPGSYIVTQIKDDGEGMSPEIQKLAIDPFFTTKPIGEGSGLGLSMAFGFARQSGGQLKIFSKAGKGTTILILLPEIE